VRLRSSSGSRRRASRLSAKLVSCASRVLMRSPCPCTCLRHSSIRAHPYRAHPSRSLSCCAQCRPSSATQSMKALQARATAAADQGQSVACARRPDLPAGRRDRSGRAPPHSGRRQRARFPRRWRAGRWPPWPAGRPRGDRRPTGRWRRRPALDEAICNGPRTARFRRLSRTSALLAGDSRTADDTDRLFLGWDEWRREAGGRLDPSDRVGRR
jgi:hypothetical protein